VRGAAAKAEARAVAYRGAIGALQAAGQDRDALNEALRWLRGEVVHAERLLRPRDAAVLHEDLNSQVTTLAEALDGTGHKADRHRREIARLRAAGQDRDALNEALRWLSSAAAARARSDPGETPGMYRQLTERITGLAAAVPGYRPERRH
jgi:type VI protein secretion system component VasF